jgi:chromosomal replication initiation ATPase DnaA
MTSQSEIIEFFREVQRVINKYGLKKVLIQLKRIQVDCGEGFESDVLDYIITITANHYIVDKNDIVNSKKRGMVSEARRMCFALIKEHLQFTDEEIGMYFGGRSRQSVNNELTDMPLNNDVLTTKQESKFVQNFLFLTTQVLRYKNSYNINVKD